MAKRDSKIVAIEKILRVAREAELSPVDVEYLYQRLQGNTLRDRAARLGSEVEPLSRREA